MIEPKRELLIVRSLTSSDLGLFAAHRAAASSKQRAININAPIARQLLSRRLFDSGGGLIDCTCVFGDTRITDKRCFSKVHKNWRLGGRKIEGKSFAKLDCRDFLLIRSVAGNDGAHPITMTFICRAADRILHAGLVAIVGNVLDRSMAVYREGTAGFQDLAPYCKRARPRRNPKQSARH